MERPLTLDGGTTRSGDAGIRARGRWTVASTAVPVRTVDRNRRWPPRAPLVPRETALPWRGGGAWLGRGARGSGTRSRPARPLASRTRRARLASGDPWARIVVPDRADSCRRTEPSRSGGRANDGPVPDRAWPTDGRARRVGGGPGTAAGARNGGAGHPPTTLVRSSGPGCGGRDRADVFGMTDWPRAGLSLQLMESAARAAGVRQASTGDGRVILRPAPHANGPFPRSVGRRVGHEPSRDPWPGLIRYGHARCRPTGDGRPARCPDPSDIPGRALGTVTVRRSAWPPGATLLCEPGAWRRALHRSRAHGRSLPAADRGRCVGSRIDARRQGWKTVARGFTWNELARVAQIERRDQALEPGRGGRRTSPAVPHRCWAGWTALPEASGSAGAVGAVRGRSSPRSGVLRRSTDASCVVTFGRPGRVGGGTRSRRPQVHERCGRVRAWVVQGVVGSSGSPPALVGAHATTGPSHGMDRSSPSTGSTGARHAVAPGDGPAS